MHEQVYFYVNDAESVADWLIRLYRRAGFLPAFPDGFFTVNDIRRRDGPDGKFSINLWCVEKTMQQDGGWTSGKARGEWLSFMFEPRLVGGSRLHVICGHPLGELVWRDVVTRLSIELDQQPKAFPGGTLTWKHLHSGEAESVSGSANIQASTAGESHGSDRLPLDFRLQPFQRWLKKHLCDVVVDDTNVAGIVNWLIHQTARKAGSYRGYSIRDAVNAPKLHLRCFPAHLHTQTEAHAQLSVSAEHLAYHDGERDTPHGQGNIMPWLGLEVLQIGPSRVQLSMSTPHGPTQLAYLSYVKELVDGIGVAYPQSTARDVWLQLEFQSVWFVQLLRGANHDEAHEYAMRHMRKLDGHVGDAGPSVELHVTAAETTTSKGASDWGALSPMDIVSNTAKMKQHYKDYNADTARGILKLTKAAYSVWNEAGGIYGPDCFARAGASVGRATIGRYLKAFREVGITHWDDYPLPRYEKS